MAKFIVLDTETTGTEEEDKIIQLGYMVLGKPNEKIDVIEEFASSDIPIKYGAMEVHNITPEMIADKPPLQETSGFKELQRLNIEDNIMVIHNAPFDLNMLAKDGFELKMKLIDTLIVVKHLYPDNEAFRLQFFRYQMELYKKEEVEANKLNINIKAHDAIGDVLVLKLLMSELIEEVKKQFPDTNPIDKLISLSKEIPLMKKIPFGKYYGEYIYDIVKKDKGWLDWALKNVEDMSEEFRFSINYWINNPRIEEQTAETSSSNVFMDN